MSGDEVKEMSEAAVMALMAPSDEARAEAEAAKAEGNAHFVAHRYDAAVESYSRAVALDATNPAYLNNRAFASLRLASFGATISDATAAIALDPQMVKAYYRRASAFLALGKLDEAQRDFKRCCRLAPQDPDARRRLKEVERTNTERKFLEAISTTEEKEKQVWATLDHTQCDVEDAYDGPRIGDDGVVTLAFCSELAERFRAEKKLHRRYARQILRQMHDLLDTLPTLVDVTVPDDGRITVCGDVHGQLYDLLNIFALNGEPSETNPYLFNGDFVDRGSFSVEVIFLLFAYKLALPDHMHLTRGNHETRNMNAMYGFQGEVKAKFSTALFDGFTSCFHVLPLCMCINEKVFVVHGGLFQDDAVTLDDIRAIDRRREPPDSGLMSDMMWSDPQPFPGRAPSKRGVGCQFGPDVVAQFLETNGLQLVVRSHEVKPEGFEWLPGKGLVTIFSAPNYCDQVGNKGCYIHFDGATMTPVFNPFEAVPHPAVPPMAYANSNFGFF
jgi:serine/threonine-protein phosphatase 5